MPLFLFIITVIFGLIYAWWAWQVWMGFTRYSTFKLDYDLAPKPISVVVPFRNEAQNLPMLIESLANLSYPKDMFEVILVNDHSTDNSLDILNELSHSFQVIDSSSEGKKAAQLHGVQSAMHQIIACTDADCVLPSEWLSAINASFIANERQLVFGPVLIARKNKPLQQLEFLALIGSTMGMLEKSWAVMGNGANMAFRKSAFLSVVAELNQIETPTGDDVFLLHKMAETKGAVGLIHGDNAVETVPQESFSQFLSQRIRWASKGKNYSSKQAIGVGLLVYVVNLLLLVGFFAAFAGIHSGFLFLFFIKLIADFTLLHRFSKFYKQPFSPAQFLVQEFINMIYVPFVGLFSQIANYTWKGRKY